MAPVCCWVIRGQYRVSSQGRVHNWVFVVSMEGNIRAWTRNLKKKNQYWFIQFHYLNGQKVWHLYIYLFYVITGITQQKWIILILALGNSLNLHFEFSQFRPDLIALVRGVCRFLQPWWAGGRLANTLPRSIRKKTDEQKFELKEKDATVHWSWCHCVSYRKAWNYFFHPSVTKYFWVEAKQ